jgi:hypothetical protein
METTMPVMASIVGNDPLARFLRARCGQERPVPLVATRIDVTIRGGLASVVTERTFRNTETSSIEATMTFPVPVDATLCALTARIDGRTLTATAQARQQARATYEDAVDRGKAAVLHEELLKGIHMLSVAHVAPNAEIVVTDTWTAPLSFVGGTPRLRIPTTVGEIYGRSPLAASDDLVTGDTVHEATIRIACQDGTASLLRAPPPLDGRYRVRLDTPIDIALSDWTPRRLTGVAADGRSVTLDIEPAPVAQENLDIDLLFDHSGSMGEAAIGDREGTATKYTVAKGGLGKAVGDLTAADRMRLWEFDDSVRCVGEGLGMQCRALADALAGPNGGTEIGRAFEAVLATGTARNVVIVTDGKSWVFDPQRIARSGIRVTAVLIGEDALEAGISHLAGMTGGQAFIATGSDSGDAIAAALAAARGPCLPAAPIEGTLTHVVALRRGARVIATWNDKTWGESSETAATAEARQVGATAAMLAIPLMKPEQAAVLAEHEGLVCHLTSLVLVDEAGAQQQGIPAVRKVELSAPAAAGQPMMRARSAMAPRPTAMSANAQQMEHSRACGLSWARSGSRNKMTGGIEPGSPASGDVVSAPPERDLAGIAAQIDWDADPDALRRGDLSALAPGLVSEIEAASRLVEVTVIADRLGLDSVVVVIALMARFAEGSSRSARRLARAVLGPSKTREIKEAMHKLGL